MTLAGSMGVAAPAIVNATTVYAAENETTANTEVFVKCPKKDAKMWFDHYMQFGVTGYQDANGTYYIYGDGVNYEISYTETEHWTRSQGGFNLIEEAFEFAAGCNWEHVIVVEDDSLDEDHPRRYMVCGEYTVGTITIKTIPWCCTEEAPMG